MEKPIEWTNEKGASRRLDVYVKTADSLRRNSWQRATSADIVSALAAMPTEERLAVLAQVAPGVQATLDLVAERDKALRERDAAREERDEVRAAARESDAFGQSMQTERGDANRRVKQVETERDEALKWLAEIHRTIGRGDGHGAPNDRGGLLFVPATGRYDPEATSEHSTLGEALAQAKDLATRRGAAPITLTKDDGTRERIAP